MLFLAAARKNARILLFGRYRKQHAQVIIRRERRVQAVAALYDSQPAGNDRHAVKERHAAAVKAAAYIRLPARERQERFFKKPLPVHIAARLGVAIRGALMRLQKIVVHMQHIRAIALFKPSSQRCLAGRRRAVYGDQDMRLLKKQRVDARTDLFKCVHISRSSTDSP